MSTAKTPKGKLILQTLAMPGDTNPNGDIFGGWILSQMDIAGGILAMEIATNKVVTMAVDAMTFIRPVHVGDLVCCYGELARIGTTSITLNLEVWVKVVIGDVKKEPVEQQVTKAAFTYVCIDENGKAQPVMRSCRF